MEKLKAQIRELQISGRRLYNQALAYRDKDGNSGISWKPMQEAKAKWRKANVLQAKLERMMCS